MKTYDRFIIYGLFLILLILVGWFIDNKTKTERYKCWPCSSGEMVGAYILDTKTGHVYMVRGAKDIRDLGVIGVLDLQLLKGLESSKMNYGRLKKAGFSEEEIQRYMLKEAGFTDNETNKYFSDQNTPTANKRKDIFDIVADENNPTANK